LLQTALHPTTTCYCEHDNFRHGDRHDDGEARDTGKEEQIATGK
jgi:hypothetical protein